MPVLYGRTDGGAAARLLSYALQQTYGIAALPETARLPGGKPWFPAHPHIHFSISHSGPLVLCAVGDAPLGVDIELIRPRRAGLPRCVLSQGEYTWFEARGCNWEDFYTLWTLKEGRCKYTGRGLDCSPAGLSVPLLEPGDGSTLDNLFLPALWLLGLARRPVRRRPRQPSPRPLCGWTMPPWKPSDFLKDKLRIHLRFSKESYDILVAEKEEAP